MSDRFPDFMPVSLRIAGRRLLVVGGGRTALHKTALLTRFTHGITVISPQFHEDFSLLPCRTVRKTYCADDLEGFFLVYACTDDGELNALIRRDAAQRGIPASVCDSPALCDFISPAIYKHENITVAVSSDARDVRRSIRIRDRIRQLIEEGLINIDKDDKLPSDQ
ncbi:MAG: bifunctional precorrin-2 dehydrogenase/sirohydrochlorin ferrochelatase [Tannerella sp.]|jgi:precorrin-2 dehydrogenase/sirohydrochlorin ferrochelatase|nr:bifunctional precorrin-2 dehydrogenase/sirohydrochlorin ferrochelatase [Tannerella sp.]